MENIFTSDLTIIQWFFAILSIIIIGMSKTGFSGAGLLSVIILASIFGGKPSSGLLLPLLIVADIFAVKFYNHHAEWKYVLKLLPWSIAGILIGVFTGNSVNDHQFKSIIAWLVIGGVALLVYRDFRNKNLLVPSAWWFSAVSGLAGGFSTMIGNAAGPVMAFYLLSMNLPKKSYIGTGAWFFMIVNLIKVPFQIFFWKNITVQSLTFDMFMIIPVIAGAFLGYYLIKLIPEKAFRIFIIITTLASAFALM